MLQRYLIKLRKDVFLEEIIGSNYSWAMKLVTVQAYKTNTHNYDFVFILQAEGLTAVETWVVSCIIHVFGVLAEYALILKMIQVLSQIVILLTILRCFFQGSKETRVLGKEERKISKEQSRENVFLQSYLQSGLVKDPLE